MCNAQYFEPVVKVPHGKVRLSHGLSNLCGINAVQNVGHGMSRHERSLTSKFAATSLRAGWQIGS